MSRLLIKMSLYLLAMSLNRSYSLPKYDQEQPTKLVYKDKESTLTISNPEKAKLREITFYHIVEKPYYPQEENDNSEETKESEEYFPIDQRAEEQHNNTTTHDESKIHFGREKRAVTFLEEPDSTKKQSNQPKKNQTERFKRTFYRVILDDDLDCDADDDITNRIYDIYDDKFIDIDSNSIEELYSGNSIEKLDAHTIEDPDIDYLEYVKSEEDDKSSAEDDKSPADDDKSPAEDDKNLAVDDINPAEDGKTPAEDAVSIDREKDTDSDSEKDSKPFEPCKDDKKYEKAEEKTSSDAIDDLLDQIYKITAGQYSTTELVPTTTDNTDNSNFNTLIHDIFQSHDEPIDGIIKTDSNNPPYINILKGIFTNIVKDNIIINGNIPDITEPVNIIATKDRTDDRENPAQSSQKLVSETNLKDYETTTEKHQDNFTPSTPSNIEYSKNKDFTSSKSNNDQNSPSFDEINSHKTTTEKNVQVVSTTEPKKTEASNKETEEPTKTTPAPFKDEEPSNKRTNSADVNKKLDRVLDLVDNDQFWKFLGDFGGKYLESLITNTDSLIKEEITNQVKEHLSALKKQEEKPVLEKEKDQIKADNNTESISEQHNNTAINSKEKGLNALQKPEEKPVLQKEKDEIKADKPKIEHNTEPISVKYNDTATNSKEKSSDAKEHTESLPINKHIETENTADNSKVTNVYVFYPSDNIDEIIKYIHQFAKKNNGNNLYTFSSNQNGLNHEKEKDSKNSDQTDGDDANKNNVHTTENTIKSTSISTERTPEFTTSTIALIPEKEVITESVNKQPTTEKAFSKDTTTERSPTTEQPHSNPTTESAVTKVYTNPTTEPAHISIVTTMKITPALEKTIETTTEKGSFTIESVATKDGTNTTTEPTIGTTISDVKISESKPVTTTETNAFTTELVATKDGDKISTSPTTEPPHTSKPITEATTDKGPFTTETVATIDGTVIKDSNLTTEPTTILGVEKIPDSTTKVVSKDTVTESNPITSESVTIKDIKDKDGIGVTKAVITDTSSTTEPLQLGTTTSGVEKNPDSEPTTAKDVSKDNVTESNPTTTESKDGTDFTKADINDSSPTTEPSYTSIGTTISSVEKNPDSEPTTAKDVSKDTVTESNPTTTESISIKDIKAKDGTDFAKAGINDSSPTTEPSYTSTGTTISIVEKIPDSEPTTAKDVSKDNVTESNPTTTESLSTKDIKDKNGTDVPKAVTNDTSPTAEPATSVGTTISSVEKIPEATTVKDLSKDSTTESESVAKKDKDGTDNVTQAVVNNTSSTTEPASIPVDTRNTER